MIYARVLKDISIYHKEGTGIYEHFGVKNGLDVLEVRHENKLTLDTITVSYHSGNFALINFNKPYVEKYLCLVIEWIVNNRKSIGDIKAVQSRHGTRSFGPR